MTRRFAGTVVTFPGGGHSPADPVRHLQRDRRWAEWLARWLQ